MKKQKDSEGPASSKIESGKETQTLEEKNREIQMLGATQVTTIIGEVRVKDRLEKKAFEALERRLEPQTKMCRPCRGEGEKTNGDTCSLCQGNGFVVEDADMRAIELVLAPKFPKTHVNVNADLDGMSTEDLLDLIEGM